MALDELDQFMLALAALESGDRDKDGNPIAGTHDYNATGPQTATYGRARGAYQIMEKIYPAWAKEVGVNPNDLSPEAQDKVARHKMSQYYRRYGRWDLVAVAWFAGPGRADKAAKQGIESVGGLKDVIGTSVAKYVQKAMKVMGTGPTEPLTPRREPGVPDGGAPVPMTTEQKPSPEVQFVQDSQRQQEVMAQIMSAISSAASASGGKVLDTKALFGDIYDEVG